MTGNTNVNWDDKYGGKGYLFGTKPNTFLASQAHRLKPGERSLDVGGGEGRNAVWLAEQDLQVLCIDQSDIALGKARALARTRDVIIDTQSVDLFEWSWPANAFHVVVSIHLHFSSSRRPLINQWMHEALFPGGLLFFEAFHPDQILNLTGGPSDPDFLVDATMLRRDFSGCDFLHLSEDAIVLPKRPHNPAGPATVTRAVIQKP